VVLCSQILTVAQERLGGSVVAQLDAETMARVDAALALSLGL
jgi:mRNA-degrading endonuclease toxin of MazEF toxin-antitoxin module